MMVDVARKQKLNPIQYTGSFGGISGQRDVVPVEVPEGPIKVGAGDFFKEIPSAGEKVMRKIPTIVEDFLIGNVKELAGLGANNAQYLYQVAMGKEITSKPAAMRQVLSTGAMAALDVATLGTGSLAVKGLEKIGAKRLAEKIAKSAVAEASITGGAIGTAY